MSLHWSLIAGFLYVEIAVIFLFLIPFISNNAWRKLFKSRFLKAVENQLVYYFYMVVAILVLFFLGKMTSSYVLW
jgi:B-cell receptor-associated protein 31